MRNTIDLAAAIAAQKTHPAVEMTLAELVAAFSAVHATEDDLRLKKWLQAFGQSSAWSITTEQLEIAAAAMRDHGYKASTVNRDLSSLGSCYKWAKQRRLTPTGFRSPTLDIRRYAEDIRRVEVSDAQIDAIRARALASRDRRFGAFVHLLIDTGARKSELLERTWNDVDLDAGTIHCSTTKTGVPRILHFRAETALLMRRVWKSMPKDRLMFEGKIPGEPVDYRSSWRTMMVELGFEGIRIHDMRHAAAAGLLRANVTLGVAAQVLGHSPQVLSRRYGHLETAALRHAQEQRWQMTR